VHATGVRRGQTGARSRPGLAAGGQTIRQEDLARTLAALTGSGTLAAQTARKLAMVARRFGARLQTDEILKVVWELAGPEAALERMSAAVARGTGRYSRRLGGSLRGFLRSVSAMGSSMPRRSRVLHGTPDGTPRGQRYLRRAFTHYYRALFTADAKEQAELMLMANIEVGFHEQTRLQPEIAAALNAALVDPTLFAERLIEAIFPHGGLLVAGRRLLMNLSGGQPPPGCDQHLCGCRAP